MAFRGSVWAAAADGGGARQVVGGRIKAREQMVACGSLAAVYSVLQRYVHGFWTPSYCIERKDNTVCIANNCNK